MKGGKTYRQRIFILIYYDYQCKLQGKFQSFLPKLMCIMSWFLQAVAIPPGFCVLGRQLCLHSRGGAGGDGDPSRIMHAKFLLSVFIYFLQIISTFFSKCNCLMFNLQPLVKGGVPITTSHVGGGGFPIKYLNDFSENWYTTPPGGLVLGGNFIFRCLPFFSAAQCCAPILRKIV